MALKGLRGIQMKRHKKKRHDHQQHLARHCCLRPRHPESKSSVEPRLLTDQEFDVMMYESDQALFWMLDQLKLRRQAE